MFSFVIFFYTAIQAPCETLQQLGSSTPCDLPPFPSDRGSRKLDSEKLPRTPHGTDGNALFRFHSFSFDFNVEHPPAVYTLQWRWIRYKKHLNSHFLSINCRGSLSRFNRTPNPPALSVTVEIERNTLQTKEYVPNTHFVSFQGESYCDRSVRVFFLFLASRYSFPRVNDFRSFEDKVIALVVLVLHHC